jgi:thiol-disulfide isomerase/thioredoxin
MKKIYLYGGIAAAVVLIAAAGIYVEETVNVTPVSAPAENQTPVESQTDTGAAPQDTQVKNQIELSNYGKAPNFKEGSNWLNSQPLTIADLKGKVVLVDFWTYSCINCIRTLPYVTRWYDTYKDKGLVVVGVHTPEFAFEADAGNVQQAISRFNIHYPVVQDNAYYTWNAYQNQYWPAEYLIDQQGTIVYEHFGEGNYDKTENAIRQLLGMGQGLTAMANDHLSEIQSPEMYFGTDRLQYLVSSQTPSAQGQYELASNLPLNTFSLGGNWKFSTQDVELAQGQGKINLKFHAGKLFMVASSASPARLKITVDGNVQPDVTVQDSKLYTLFDSENYADHTIEITVDQPGFSAFTFTFG